MKLHTCILFASVLSIANAAPCTVDSDCTGLIVTYCHTFTCVSLVCTEQFRAAGTKCRAALDTCDVAEACDGASSACPADAVAAAGTVCRAAVAGGCDVAETCDGVSTACPFDVIAAAGTVCRAAVAGGCDVAETCDGASNTCPTDVVIACDVTYILRQQPVRPGGLATEWTQSVTRSSIFTSVELKVFDAVGCDVMPLQIRVGCGTGDAKSACDTPDYTTDVWVTNSPNVGRRGAPGHFVPLPDILVNATDANDGDSGLLHVWITVSDAYSATECTGYINDLTLHSTPMDAMPTPTAQEVIVYSSCHPVSSNCSGTEVHFPLAFTTQFVSPCHGGYEVGSELTITTDDHIFYNIRYRAATHVDTIEGTVRCDTCTWKTGASLWDFSIEIPCPAPVPGVPTSQPPTLPSPQDPVNCSYPATDYKMGSVQLAPCADNADNCSAVVFPLGVRREICDPCYGPHVGGHMTIVSIDHVSYTMIYSEDNVTMVYTVQCGTCISQQIGDHDPFEVTIVCPSPPTPAPPLPTTVTDEDNRMVAFMANWQACPSEKALNEYSHLLVSFAVTYKWAPMANECDAACTIKPLLVCDNAKQPELIDKWRAAGKKVLLTFGGAGMGGSWDGVNRCWEHCFGKEDSVVSQL
eukprot:Rhum_TRINITY_DN13862_c0_g1::Rhum_TRINITY_DN13862_c0_g1_i1::g.65126::m.65126